MPTSMNGAETPSQDTDTLEKMDSVEFIEFVSRGEDLSPYLSEQQLTDIASDVSEQYTIDKASMSDWLSVMSKGIDLAKMSKGDKTYPYKNASNIKYPLVTSAAMQYNARTYPAIVPSGDPIKCKVHGNDPEGLKADRAVRVGSFGSYQLKTKNPRWEPDTDRLLFIGPIVGTVFRKYWYDPASETVKSRLCEPGSVIVNNHITDLSEAPAITEEFSLYIRDIEKRRRTGWYRDVEIDGENYLDNKKPEGFIEQITYIDLDEDGLTEPYVVTVHKNSQTVMRVTAAFDAEDVRLSEDGAILDIEANSFYVDYHFLPSFDGSFLGNGFGALLGDISETINTILNQLMDAGHYSSQGGGFIGAQNFKIRGGVGRFSPGEWKVVNAMGGDIRQGIVPMEYPQPSPVLFQLLGVMLEAGRDLSSTSNLMTGDASAANMPVGTVMALIEQGLQVFTASYKRVYVAMKKEFALLCRLNARYLSPETYTAFFDEGKNLDPRADFNLNDMDITPVADHKAVTDMQRMGKAQFLLELASQGLVDQSAALMRILEAANIDNVEELIRQPDPMQAQLAQMQAQSMILDMQMKSVQIDNEMADTQSKLAKAAKDVASAESEDLGRDLSAYLSELKKLKEAFDANRRNIEGMAGASSNGSPVRPTNPTSQVPEVGTGGELSGGPAAY